MIVISMDAQTFVDIMQNSIDPISLIESNLIDIRSGTKSRNRWQLVSDTKNAEFLVLGSEGQVTHQIDKQTLMALLSTNDKSLVGQAAYSNNKQPSLFSKFKAFIFKLRYF